MYTVPGRVPCSSPQLTDGLEEGEALDVTDGSADLGDDDVDSRAAAILRTAGLDLVRDVRDDLDRAAEVLAAPLLVDHRLSRCWPAREVAGLV